MRDQGNPLSAPKLRTFRRILLVSSLVEPEKQRGSPYQHDRAVRQGARAALGTRTARIGVHGGGIAGVERGACLRLFPRRGVLTLARVHRERGTRKAAVLVPPAFGENAKLRAFPP